MTADQWEKGEYGARRSLAKVVGLVVVSVAYDTNAPPRDREAATYWRLQGAGSLPEAVL
jgi:hypothetical protein